MAEHGQGRNDNVTRTKSIDRARNVLFFISRSIRFRTHHGRCGPEFKVRDPGYAGTYGCEMHFGFCISGLDLDLS